jgi:putative FmdB family regulatory protein
MPTYEYHCVKCDKNFDIIHPPNQMTPVCTLCGAKKPERVMVFPAIHGAKTPLKSKNRGYTGRNQDLVNKMSEKSWRDGYRKEHENNKKLDDAVGIFEKMKAEGAKMSKAEKDAMKKEYGINKSNIKVRAKR